jgi:hypothetical protein
MSSLAPKPKVVAAVIGGIIASAVLSNVTLITPDLFTGLGKASGLVYGLTITLVIGVCGWLKSDATSAADSSAQPDPATVTPAPVDALTAPPSVYPSDAVAAAEAPVEVTPIIPGAAPEVTPTA